MSGAAREVRTSDLFGEFDPVGVRQGAWLLINVMDVQNLTHELDHRLGFVERRGRHYSQHKHIIIIITIIRFRLDLAFAYR